MSEHFHISFKRSGGFAGTSISAEIDSRELESSVAEELNLLIDRSAFFELFVIDNSYLHMPDQFRYEMCIEHMGKNRVLKLSEGSLPDRLRPLIKYLLRLARAARKD